MTARRRAGLIALALTAGWMGCLSLAGCGPRVEGGEAPDEVRLEASVDPQLGVDAVIAHQRLTALLLIDMAKSAGVLQAKVAQFLEQPTPRSLAGARQAWLVLRVPMGHARALIALSPSAPEPTRTLVARALGWPADPAFLDQPTPPGPPGGTPALVQDTAFELTPESILQRASGSASPQAIPGPATTSTATTAPTPPGRTGVHALEYLLWGPDDRPSGPGLRDAADYTAGDEQRDRRRDLLELLAAQLVEDLQALAEQWVPEEGDAAKAFAAKPPARALGEIMAHLAWVSEDLARRQIEAALAGAGDAGESSRYADNTQQDLLYAAQSVEQVYRGAYRNFKGHSIAQLVRGPAPDPLGPPAPTAADAPGAQLEAALARSVQILKQAPRPFDAVIASSPEGEERQHYAMAAQALRAQAQAIRAAAAGLGIRLR